MVRCLVTPLRCGRHRDTHLLDLSNSQRARRWWQGSVKVAPTRTWSQEENSYVMDRRIELVSGRFACLHYGGRHLCGTETSQDALGGYDPRDTDRYLSPRAQELWNPPLVLVPLITLTSPLRTIHYGYLERIIVGTLLSNRPLIAIIRPPTVRSVLCPGRALGR